MSPSEIKNLNEQILTFFNSLPKLPSVKESQRGSTETEIALLLTSRLHLNRPSDPWVDMATHIKQVTQKLTTYRLWRPLALLCALQPEVTLALPRAGQIFLPGFVDSITLEGIHCTWRLFHLKIRFCFSTSSHFLIPVPKCHEAVPKSKVLEDNDVVPCLVLI